MAFRIWKRKIEKYGSFSSKSVSQIFDIGCGAGWFLGSLESWFPTADIFGVDVDREVLEFAASRLAFSVLQQCSGEELPFDDGLFDVVSLLIPT